MKVQEAKIILKNIPYLQKNQEEFGFKSNFETGK